MLQPCSAVLLQSFTISAAKNEDSVGGELLHCRPEAPGGFHEAENIPTLDTLLLY
jgi:hypothetical protein